MGRALEIVGLGAVCCVIIAGGGFAGLAMAGGDLDKDSRAYAESAVQAITPNWSTSELLSRSDFHITSAPTQQISGMFDQVRKLGQPINKGCRGDSMVNMLLGQPVRVSATYVCQLAVPRGFETLSLKLLRDPQGDWIIAGFLVNSPLLTVQAAQG